MNIIVPNAIDDKHYNDVKSYMSKAGAPVIKAVYMPCWDMWVALEGSHRVHAAKELGLEPVIKEVGYSDDSMDNYTDDRADDMGMTVADFCDRAYQNAIVIEF